MSGKIVNSNSCEFGYELISVLPYAYSLYQQGKLDKTISNFDTKCLYFFSPNHEEINNERSWENVVKLQKENFPNMKIHRRELDWEYFSAPPFKEYYSDKKITFEKETLVIFNRYNKEWHKDPINFLDLNTLDKLFEMLSDRYQVVYLNLNNDSRYFDHFKPMDLNDSSIVEKYPSVLTFDKLKERYPQFSINELQCRIFAGCEKYISSNGGQLILSAYFGGENIIFSKKCNELNPEINSFYGWYHKLGKGIFQHVNNYDDLLDLVYQKWILNKPLVNILIRTSNRPNYFKECINSVYNQTYKNVNIIAGVDTPESYEYVKGEKCRIVRYRMSDFTIPEKPDLPEYGNDFIPNSYMNKLMDECQLGYIMYLDDDDAYFDNESLKEIVSSIDNEDSLLFWKVKFPHRIVPGESKFGKPPVLTEVDTVGFMFPVKYRVDWEPFTNGDFRVVKELYNKVPNKKYINKILTKVLRNVKVGRGLRDDKIENADYVTEIKEEVIIQKEEIIIQNKYSNVKIEPVKPELTKKEINYDKINSIFTNNNPKVISKPQPVQSGQKLKLNSETFSKIQRTKKRLR